MEQKVQGLGCILASQADYEGLTGARSLDAWRSALQLPTAYDIEQVCPTDPPTNVVLIFVRNAQIPVVTGNEPLPYVCPIYQCDEAGNRASLLRVEIQQYSEADGWHTIAVTDEHTI